MQIREIMLFLHSHGISTGRAVRIYKTYGEQAIENAGRTHTLWQKTFTASASPRRIRLPNASGFPRTRKIGPRQGSTTCCWGNHRGTLRSATGETEAGSGETVGCSGGNNRAGPGAHADQWLSCAGGDRRRASDLPASPEEG